jgi:S1-C subfamily serine protease
LGTLIQTDAKLAFSTGGGALVNLRGELIGLTTSAATIAGHERPAGYAIPMNSTFRRVIDTLKEGREVEYGLIGVGLGSSTGTTIVPLDPKLHTTGKATLGPTGVPIQNVMPGSPAALAGLRIGDRITHIDDHPVENARQLQLLVGTLRPATITQVRYHRGETPRRVSIELAKYPLESRAIVTEHSPAWRGIRVDYSTTAELARNAPDAIVSTPDPAGCVVIREVLPDSPSWKAGIRPGMYISHVGDQRVTSPKAFHNAVDAAEGTVGIHLTQPVPGKLERKPGQPQADPLLPGSPVEL